MFRAVVSFLWLTYHHLPRSPWIRKDSTHWITEEPSIQSWHPFPYLASVAACSFPELGFRTPPYTVWSEVKYLPIQGTNNFFLSITQNESKNNSHLFFGNVSNICLHPSFRLSSQSVFSKMGPKVGRREEHKHAGCRTKTRTMSSPGCLSTSNFITI